jgi:hypothetical protein
VLGLRMMGCSRKGDKSGCYQICNHYQLRPRVTGAAGCALKALPRAGLMAMGSTLLACNSLCFRAATATNQKVGSSNLSGRARFAPEIPRCARDFGWRLPLAAARLAHAAKTPQVRISQGAPCYPKSLAGADPSQKALGISAGGSRSPLRASLTPPKRLKLWMGSAFMAGEHPRPSEA